VGGVQARAGVGHGIRRRRDTRGQDPGLPRARDRLRAPRAGQCRVRHPGHPR
jgi:hypothetical protein